MQIRHVLLPLLLLAAYSARADITITNLDSIPYDLKMEIGGAEQLVAVEPNETWSTAAWPVYVYVKNRRMALEADGGYAIWKGGSIAKQTRGAIGRKH